MEGREASLVGIVFTEVIEVNDRVFQLALHVTVLQTLLLAERLHTMRNLLFLWLGRGTVPDELFRVLPLDVVICIATLLA